jgi:hypothetical protein
MKAKMYTFCAYLILFCGNALAVAPASGLWWNPQESGRGFTIDIQDNIMIVTAYTYDSGHKATWFLASGIYNQNTNTFTGTLGAYSGGQCFGCTYSNPTAVAAGSVTIVFSSPETGVLSYPGGQTNIQHEIYAYSSKMDYFYGEWSYTLDISSLLSTQFVIFNSTYTSSSGAHYISGVQDGLSTTSALGTYDPTSNSFIVATGDSSFTYLYKFAIADDRRMLGYGAITTTGGSTPPLSEASAASRLFSKSELAIGKSLKRGDVADLPRLAAAIESQIASR